MVGEKYPVDDAVNRRENYAKGENLLTKSAGKQEYWSGKDRFQNTTEWVAIITVVTKGMLLYFPRYSHLTEIIAEEISGPYQKNCSDTIVSIVGMENCNCTTFKGANNILFL